MPDKPTIVQRYLRGLDSLRIAAGLFPSAVIALTFFGATPAQARFHLCQATYMFGETRYEFSGNYSSPMFNMVYETGSGRLYQGNRPTKVEWNKDLVTSADTSPFGSVMYYPTGITDSVRIDGGSVVFVRPIDTPKLYLEAGGKQFEGMMGRSWPSGPQNSIRLYASFDAGSLADVRSAFAVIVADSTGNIVYRARYGGVTKKMEAEARSIHTQIYKMFELKPASGRGHPPECS